MRSILVPDDSKSVRNCSVSETWARSETETKKHIRQCSPPRNLSLVRIAFDKLTGHHDAGFGGGGDDLAIRMRTEF